MSNTAEVLETKVCNKCGIEKYVTEFTFRKETGKYRNQCKACVKETNNQTNLRIIAEGLPEGKVCSKCKEYKLSTEFSLHKGRIRSNCKECEHKHYESDLINNRIKKRDYSRIHSVAKNEYQKVRYQDNKEQILAECKARYELNKESIQLWHKQYYIDNPDKYIEKLTKAQIRNQGTEQRLITKERALKYKKKNPEVVAISTQNHRAMKLGAPGKLTLVSIRALRVTQNNLCHYCEVSIADYYEIEHAQPMSKNGTNYIENIRLSCLPCNRSKGVKTEQQFFDFMRAKDHIETLALLKYWR